MSRGNMIIVSAEPDGTFDEGFVAAGETHKPGLIVQQDPTVALQGGRATYKIYNPGTDGEHPLGPLWVVLNGVPIGIDAPTGVSYPAGSRIAVYCPKPGEELNVLVKNLAGTADDHIAGEKMMVDTGTGMLIVTTGTPESEPFMLLESIVDPVADTLAWVRFSGY